MDVSAGEANRGESRGEKRLREISTLRGNMRGPIKAFPGRTPEQEAAYEESQRRWVLIDGRRRAQQHT